MHFSKFENIDNDLSFWVSVQNVWEMFCHINNLTTKLQIGKNGNTSIVKNAHEHYIKIQDKNALKFAKFFIKIISASDECKNNFCISLKWLKVKDSNNRI
jgi:hypothetical protein